MTDAQTDTGPARIDSLEQLCAHALELEHESTSRFHQLADSMEVHHNPEVADLFRRLAALSEAHAEKIAEDAQGLALPRIPPWDFQWNCPDGPESHCLDENVSYLMTAAQALRLALFNEEQAQAFYQEIAGCSGDARARALAAEMAAEEAEHAQLLRQWLEQIDDSEPPPSEDLDPPNVPE